MTNRLLRSSIALVALMAPQFATAQGVFARVSDSEQAVREMELLERPNRIGHFYGNTVRRRHYGSLVVNSRHSERPLARYFYIAR